MLDRSLIKTFRDKVNSNSYFALYKYSNAGDKNQWNVICSCMDWIEVAVDYLENSVFDTENINVESMQVYTYISSIDIIWESIQQLHRVIIGDVLPFEMQKLIFKDNDICKNDNLYFKHIRAVFGAHPNNLDLYDKAEKWFASWPSKEIYEDYDFAVTLYSLDVKKHDVVFGFRFIELEQFAKTRYEYLNQLIVELDNQYNKYSKEKSNEIIESNEDISKQLSILKTASRERLNNDYYNYIIDDLIVMFDAVDKLGENKKLVAEYRNKLELVILELKNNLQQMVFQELRSDSIIEMRHPEEIHYALSKTFEYIRGTRDESMHSYHIKKISIFLKDQIIIHENMDNKELYLLIKAGLHRYWSEQ